MSGLDDLLARTPDQPPSSTQRGHSSNLLEGIVRANDSAATIIPNSDIMRSNSLLDGTGATSVSHGSSNRGTASNAVWGAAIVSLHSKSKSG